MQTPTTQELQAAKWRKVLLRHWDDTTETAYQCDEHRVTVFVKSHTEPDLDGWPVPGGLVVYRWEIYHNMYTDSYIVDMGPGKPPGPGPMVGLS